MSTVLVIVTLRIQLVAYWEVHYPPFRRTYVITNVNLLMNVSPARAFTSREN